MNSDFFSNISLGFILGLSIYGMIVLAQQLHECLASYISSVIFFS